MSRVIRFHQFGPPEVLKCEELPTPAPAAGEVLVRVQAIGVSWKDVLWRQNLAPEQAALPSGLGFELAGEVLAVGAGVGDLPLGSRVASFPAHTPDHYPAYGDVVLMPRAALAVYPEVLTPVEASVYYTGLLVAYFGLVDLAGLKAGQTVLITEAARMYGPVSIQLAKALGARVIASTKSAEEREFLREQGADKVVVTDEQDLVLEVERFTEGKGVNVILDELGGPQMTLLGDVSATRGKLVLYGCNGGNESAFPACAAFKKHLQFYRHCLMDFTGHPEMGLERNDESVSKALAHIEQLTRDRLLKPVVDRVFEFDQVVEAHRYMETCPKRGRVVIHAARHHIHLAGAQVHRAVAEIDAQATGEDDEGLVGVGVAVPDEVAFDLHQLELVVVHLGDHPGLPAVVEQGELGGEVDRLGCAGGHRCAPVVGLWRQGRRLRSGRSWMIVQPG